jgi:hypothetical protein
MSIPVLNTSIACALAAVLIAAHVGPTAAMSRQTQVPGGNSVGADGPVPVRWRGHARGMLEDALIARAIANGVMADPGPLYGRYLGYHGYPGHYPCCYEPQVLDRIYNPYYGLSRAGLAHPTWWDYPVHWEGW